MFKNSSKILFLIILMLGTILTISANSWLGAWMGLEINLLAFIPLMNDYNNLMSSEAALKYFLTQAIASSVLLFAIIYSMLKLNFTYQILMNMDLSLLIFSTLLLKAGAAPFHFWFPGVMEGLSWMNSFILMTWQKIAPLMLISYLPNIEPFIIIIAVTSVSVGSIGGLNQTSMRKLMAFSSINHIGWMLAAMLSNESLWMSYFLFYTFLTGAMVTFFNTFKIFHMNQLFSNFMRSKTLKFMVFFNLLSLGGLPPFMGFLPKWLVIQYLVSSNQIVLMISLTIMTLLTLFFYLRLCYSAFMLNYTESSFTSYEMLNFSHMKILLILSLISTLGLVVVSFMFFVM